MDDEDGYDDDELRDLMEEEEPAANEVEKWKTLAKLCGY